MVVGARRSFQFFREMTWFLGNKRALSKFKYYILHHSKSGSHLPKKNVIFASLKPL